jgi:hypothetical protein
LHLDAERLALVHKKTQVLQPLYRADVQRFLSFLDSLLEMEE